MTYGMGITQHNKGTANVRLIADLLLLRGNIGKPRRHPLRGHSNVQGNRHRRHTEKPSADFWRSWKRCLASRRPKPTGMMP
ncbi:hypothetical protein M8494_10210 [Serratia ureilytica]